jgi:hypothetical protein
MRQEPRVLLPNAPAGGNWIGFRLRGIKSNRSAIGATVQITAWGATQVNQVTSAGNMQARSAGPLRDRLR